MDSIADLLAKRKNDEPADSRAIKAYVREQFNETVGVTVRDRDILVTVRSSALAGALRMHGPKIALHLEDPAKRLVFRVGHV